MSVAPLKARCYSQFERLTAEYFLFPAAVALFGDDYGIYLETRPQQNRHQPLMFANHVIVKSTAIPEESELRRAYTALDLSDAYSISLPPSASEDPEILARHIFAQQASWVSILMSVRDSIVSVFGLKTSRDLQALNTDRRTMRVGIFKIYNKGPNEIVLGEEDRHMDFRLSVLILKQPGSPIGNNLVLSTVVHCHNLLGRAYVLVIEPFHRLVIKSYLRRAAIVGWPSASKS